MKKLVSLILCLCMLLSLAACGGNTEKTKDKADQPTSAVPTLAGTASGGDRYQAEFTQLRTGFKSSVTPMCYTDSGFYAKGYDDIGSRQLGEGVTAEYEGQYDVFQYRLYFAGYDGQLRLMEDYAPAYVMENTGGLSKFSASSDITGLTVNGAGEPVVFEMSSAYYYDGPAELTENDEEYWQYYHSDHRYFIRRLGPNGEELGSAEPDLSDMLLINEGCVTDQQGNLIVYGLSNDGNYYAIALAEDGSEVYRLTFDGSYASGLVTLGDGSPAIVGQLPEGWGIEVIDAESKSFSGSYILPIAAEAPLAGDGSFDLYYISGSRLYGYSLETEEPAEILNLLDCDVNSNNIYGVSVRPDGAVMGVELSWSGDYVTSSLVKLTKTPAGSASEKKVLTLAAVGLDFYAQGAVVQFNRQSQDYRIEVLDYSQYNADPGDTAGLTKLTTEILAGNMPDILSLSGLPYDQLAAKGLLEDLYPYLDSDGELNREDFFSTVLSAMEVGGGLYQACPYFSVSTAIAARSVVGDRQGWTYDELLQALATLPEGSTVFSPGTTKENALYKCLTVSMDSLVDWANGTCRFDSEDFLSLLDFANSFPGEVPEDDGTGSGVRLLRETTVNEFRSLPIDEIYFGGQGSTVYIGYPTFDGSCGSAIDLDDGFAMSASCSDKEAAWQFLRIFMTEDYQTSEYKLPTNRARFEKTLKRSMIPEYELDENGNYILDADGNRVQKPVVEFDGIPIYCMNQDQANRMLALIDSCTKVVRPTVDQILNIVLEDARAYFAGQKSAQEVAKLIQSKVSIYISEQS